MTTPQILQPIPPGDGSGGVLPSSFAIGDILYADSTSTLKSLADVAVGSVLVSGGVGAAPAWSAAPSLTSLTLSGAGSASLSPLLLSGAILTGGTATTNFPALFIQPTGATAVTSWNTSGTGLGMNAATGFGGNFLDFHIAGAASLFKVDSLGNLTMSGDFAGPNAGKISLRNGNTILSSPGSAIWQIGAADAAAPVAQTLGVQNVVAGTTNTAGAVTTIRGSAGTGTGVGGNIVFQYAPHGSTGSTQNAFATAVTINGDTGLVTFAQGITSSLNVSIPTGYVAAQALRDATGTTKIDLTSSGFIDCVTGQVLRSAGGANAAFASLASFTSGAGAGAGTLTNAPASGNPTSWIKIIDNGTTRYIPAW